MLARAYSFLTSSLLFFLEMKREDSTASTSNFSSGSSSVRVPMKYLFGEPLVRTTSIPNSSSCSISFTTVIDGNFTYRVAKNGRRTHFNFSSSSASSQSYSIYADYSTKDFRVAIAWESESSSTNTSLTDYDLYIYKNGEYVASSSGLENYEVLIIPASVIAEFGAGYVDEFVS